MKLLPTPGILAVLLASSPAWADGVYTTLARYGCLYGSCQPGLPSTQIVETAPGRFVGALTYGSIYSLGIDGSFAIALPLETYFAGMHTPLHASDGMLYFPAPASTGNAVLYRFNPGDHTIQAIATPAPYNALTPVETPDRSLHSASVPVNGVGWTISMALDSQVVSADQPVSKNASIHTLVEASDGTVYGLAAPWASGGNSSLIRMNAAGRYTVVSSFERTVPALTEASDGNFYGCTEHTLFRLTPQGVFTTIHSFEESSPARGASTCLIQASDGELYGTTYDGGAHGFGTVFRTTLAGEVTTVHSFTGADDAQHPSQYVGGLVQGSDGKLYGQTSSAMANAPGSHIGATTYSLDLGLPRPAPAVVLASPQRATAGAHVVLWGRNFLGTTAVTLGAAPVPFTVKAREYLDITVPAGAKSGKVTVTTPNGSGTSSFLLVVR